MSDEYVRICERPQALIWDSYGVGVARESRIGRSHRCHFGPSLHSHLAVRIEKHSETGQLARSAQCRQRRSVAEGRSPGGRRHQACLRCRNSHNPCEALPAAVPMRPLHELGAKICRRTRHPPQNLQAPMAMQAHPVLPTGMGIRSHQFHRMSSTLLQ